MRVLIINFNRITLTSRLADWCSDKGLDVIIVDNCSFYQPLQEYYYQCPYPVIRLRKNYGSHAVWDARILNILGIEGQYIVTDSDLDLSNVPDDFLDIMKQGLKKYPWAVKCGLSLEINDLPDTEQGDFIRQGHENKYWQAPLDDLYFKAATASTFALYKRGITQWQLAPAIRINRPYTARHVPWYYESFEALPEDEKFYYETTNARWATGKERVKAL